MLSISFHEILESSVLIATVRAHVSVNMNSESIDADSEIFIWTQVKQLVGQSELTSFLVVDSDDCLELELLALG